VCGTCLSLGAYFSYSFKTTSYQDFAVNHLSHWDHKHAKNEPDIEKMAGAAERECGLLTSGDVASNNNNKSAKRNRPQLVQMPHLGTPHTVPNALPRSFFHTQNDEKEESRKSGGSGGSGGGSKGGEGGDGGIAEGWKSVALVPFWGGSAAASGGNAHSNAKREVKVSRLTLFVFSPFLCLSPGNMITYQHQRQQP
jgi:hypothetical protein